MKLDWPIVPCGNPPDISSTLFIPQGSLSLVLFAVTFGNTGNISPYLIPMFSCVLRHHRVSFVLFTTGSRLFFSQQGLVCSFHNRVSFVLFTTGSRVFFSQQGLVCSSSPQGLVCSFHNRVSCVLFTTGSRVFFVTTGSRVFFFTTGSRLFFSPQGLVYTGVLNFDNVAPSGKLLDMGTGFKIRCMQL